MYIEVSTCLSLKKESFALLINLYYETSSGGIDLSGTWGVDVTLDSSGVCDEILIMDETNATLDLIFNDNGTLTFLNDPADLGLNGSEFLQTYSLDIEANILYINIKYTDTGENYLLTAPLNWDSSSNSFSGTYTNDWGD